MGIIGGVSTMAAKIVCVIPDVARPMHSETLACVPASTSVAREFKNLGQWRNVMIGHVNVRVVQVEERS
jgi:hypothetical protein